MTKETGMIEATAVTMTKAMAAYNWELDHEGESFLDNEESGLVATLDVAADSEVLFEFEDGSILTQGFYADALEGDPPVCNDMAEFLDLVDARNVSIGIAGDLELVGTVAADFTSSRADLTLKLTEITHDGEPYLTGSTDWESDHTNECPVIYTHALNKLMGQRVRLTCTKDTFRENRYTSRGNSYGVNVDFLNFPEGIEAVLEAGVHAVMSDVGIEEAITG